MEFKLESDLSEIHRIYIIAMENFLYSRYFYRPKNDKEKSFADKSRDLRFIRHSLFKLCVIELSKLISRSNHDEFRLWNIIKRLKNDQYLDYKKEKKHLEDWLEKLNSIKDESKKVLQLRNKLYAHSDVNRDISFDLEFKDIEKCLEVIEFILNEIHLRAFNTIFYRNPIYFTTGKFNILTRLSEMK